MAEIVLTPEMLIAQSTQMQTLAGEFESLFSQTTTVLHGMNDSWSENIATNFVSKILLAQQSFSSITNMLNNGSMAAKFGALSFQNGVNMGDMLDSTNPLIDPVTGRMTYDDGDDSNGIEMSASIKATGKPKEDYFKSLGDLIRQDSKDLDEMIRGDKTPSYGDVAAKYIDMVWHYFPGGALRAFASATGLDYDESMKNVKGFVGDVIGGFTGDSGMREAYEHSYENGLGTGYVEGVKDIGDYLLNNTSVGQGAVKIWKSIVN